MPGPIDAADLERLRNPTTRVEVVLLDALQAEIGTLRVELVAAKSRALAAEAEAKRLSSALRRILATDLGFEWDGTGTAEEKAINAARAALKEPGHE